MTKKHQERSEVLEEKLEDIDIEDVEELEEYFDQLAFRNREKLCSIISKRIKKAGITAKWLQDNLPVCKTVAGRLKEGTWYDFLKDDPHNRKEEMYKEIIFKIIVILSIDQDDAFELLKLAGFYPNKYGSSEKEKLMCYIIERAVEEEAVEHYRIRDIYRDRNGTMNDIILTAIKSCFINITEKDFKIPKVDWWEATDGDDVKTGIEYY